MVHLSNVFLISGNSGQGKTTVAKNLAFGLRQFGFDVLLVDADTKTPKLGHHVGVPLAERTIQGVLLGVRSLRDSLYVHPSGLKLLLSGLSEVNVPHPSSLLEGLKGLADVVIVDSSARDAEWRKQGLNTVLVCQPDFPSVLEARKYVNSDVVGVVVNKCHFDEFDLSEGNISEIVSKPVFGMVPFEPRVREALKHGYSIVEFHPEFRASVELKKIAAKLMNLEYDSPVRKPLLAKFGL